jgi:hypothetical protein
MNRFLVAVLLFFLSETSALAADSDFASDTAKANLDLGPSDSISVVVETTEPPSGFAFSKSYEWGGDEATPPRRIISIITVTRNGKNLFIPLSAFADLGSPRGMSLQRLSSRSFRITITGGDAAGSYNAMLDFKNGEIVQRRVVSGEFPREVWGKTTYSFNHLNN